MAWTNVYKSRIRMKNYNSDSFKSNKDCFIRKKNQCEKLFGASKSCFIACPTDEELNPLLSLISEKLGKAGIEPIIAVQERAYGQDIFCTKICGKIIESKFCIVILDNTVNNECPNTPNPNVYYEYGLMTALKKHIIPLQKEDHDLAFNIQSYDTIKYTNGNMSSELDIAIKDAIKITEPADQIEIKGPISERTILRRMELAGFELKSKHWVLGNVIDDTDFKGFTYYDGKYSYFAKIDGQSEFQTYLEDLEVVLYRTEKKLQEKINELEDLNFKKTELDGLLDSLGRRKFERIMEEISITERMISRMSNMIIGFIINPNLDSELFIEKIESSIQKFDSIDYQLIYSNNNEIEIDDNKISFSSETADFI